jgi:hypothetical protein
MPRSSSKKAQFFILTAVIVIGVFFTLSKYINQYSLIDTSQAAQGSEFLMIDNIKDKALKTVHISNMTNIYERVPEYRDFVQEVVAERGYILDFGYNINSTERLVIINMSLISDKYTLKSDFSTPIPDDENYDCTDFCDDLEYGSGSCVMDPYTGCEDGGGDYYPEANYHCPAQRRCCCT